MPRVTDAEVRKVVIVDAALDIDSFIQTANLLVTEDLASAGMSTDRLRQIELYLSAHLVALSDEKGGITRDKTGESDLEFSDVYEAGLRSTRFGQQALILDTSGVLAAQASSKVKAEFRVV